MAFPGSFISALGVNKTSLNSFSAQLFNKAAGSLAAFGVLLPDACSSSAAADCQVPEESGFIPLDTIKCDPDASSLYFPLRLLGFRTHLWLGGASIHHPLC